MPLPFKGLHGWRLELTFYAFCSGISQASHMGFFSDIRKADIREQNVIINVSFDAEWRKKVLWGFVG